MLRTVAQSPRIRCFLRRFQTSCEGLRPEVIQPRFEVRVCHPTCTCLGTWSSGPALHRRTPGDASNTEMRSELSVYAKRGIRTDLKKREHLTVFLFIANRGGSAWGWSCARPHSLSKTSITHSGRDPLHAAYIVIQVSGCPGNKLRIESYVVMYSSCSCRYSERIPP